jgi:hypothetical protein
MGKDKHETARRSGKGKWYKGQYAGMEKYVLESPRFQSLKDGDRIALVYVLLQCYPGKNGHFHLSCRELGESMGVSHNTANKRLQTLVDAGFLKVMRPAGFNKGDRKAAEYRVMHFPCNKTGDARDVHYLNKPYKYPPPKLRADRVRGSKLIFTNGNKLN